jgi:hypothetical protein
MSDLSKKSNKELMEYQQNLKKDFEIVREELKRKYDHWKNIESEYNKVANELMRRYGIKNS